MVWFIILALVVLLGSFMVFFGAPYVPSQRKYVLRAFEHFKIGPSDVLVDVGSGDGIVLRIAAARGARAVGYEINPVLVLVSRLLAVRYPKATIHLANFWRRELPADTTVVYAFAVSRDGQKLQDKLQAEADRLNHDLTLLCYASPLKGRPADKTFEAYHLYQFRPLHSPKAQV